RVVHDQLSLSSQGVGRRIELARGGGIGDLLDADGDVHFPILVTGWLVFQIHGLVIAWPCSGRRRQRAPGRGVTCHAAPTEEEVLTTEDEVRLVLPAAPEFLRLARITAAGLASRLGFTLDQV